MHFHFFESYGRESRLLTLVPRPRLHNDLFHGKMLETGVFIFLSKKIIVSQFALNNDLKLFIPLNIPWREFCAEDIIKAICVAKIPPTIFCSCWRRIQYRYFRTKRTPSYKSFNNILSDESKIASPIISSWSLWLEFQERYTVSDVEHLHRCSRYTII
jgi:hypothetical protein